MLQHCADPRAEIARIVRALPAGGRLAVLNSAYGQALPVAAGWDIRNIDMRAMLQETLVEMNAEKLPAEVAAPDLLDTSFFGLYRNGDAPTPAGEPTNTPASGGALGRLKRLLSGG